MSKIQGIFGDPKARVIRLKRSQKKRNAAAAASCIAAIMTSLYDGYGTCPVGMRVSTWKWKFGASGARGAGK